MDQYERERPGREGKYRFTVTAVEVVEQVRELVGMGGARRSETVMDETKRVRFVSEELPSDEGCIPFEVFRDEFRSGEIEQVIPTRFGVIRIGWKQQKQFKDFWK